MPFFYTSLFPDEGMGTPAGFTVSFRAYGATNEQASATSINMEYPSGTQVGDIVIAFIMHRSALTTPTGWTLIGTAQNDGTSGADQWISVLKRIYAGTEGTYQLFTQASSGRMESGAVSFSKDGGTWTTSNYTSGTYYTASADPGLHPIQSVQGTASGQMAIIASTCAYSQTGTTYNPPAGWTKVAGDNSNSNNRMCGAYIVAPTSSSTSGNIEHDFPSSSPHDGGEAAFILKAI